MFISDIKNAICNKRMLLSVVAAFLCLLVGGAEELFGRNAGIDFSYMFLRALSCGTSSLLALIYPVFACLPYSDIYEIERSSGYILYKRLKIKRTKYVFSKLAACSLSGGLAVSLPVAAYFILCILYKGTSSANSGGLTYIVHGLELYQRNPVLYCAVYICNAFWCGMIFALMGMVLSVIIRNKYLIIFLPLVIYILLNIIFSNTFINLNPTLWWDINLYSESNAAYVNFVKILLVFLLAVLYSFGVMKDEKE